MVRRCKVFLTTLILFLGFLAPKAMSQNIFQDTNNPACLVVLSGIGCHNCAETDPVILTEWVRKYPDLIVFKYEIFKAQYVNAIVKDLYFENYLNKENRPGVPFVMFNQKLQAIGKTQVLDFEKVVELTKTNDFPLPDGNSIPFADLKLDSLQGQFTIWTKNRVLIGGKDSKGVNLKELLLKGDINEAIKALPYVKVNPIEIETAGGMIQFTNAVAIGDWRLQWNGDPVRVTAGTGQKSSGKGLLAGLIVSLLLIFVPIFFLGGKRKVKKGEVQKFNVRTRIKDIVIAVICFSALIIFFILAKQIPAGFLEQSGFTMPLPLFTAIIALVDSVNPCNMFVLTGLLALLVATSHSRFRLYVVGLSFVATVFVIYFLFMAAWLNVFKYLNVVTPLRIGIGIMAIVVGIINCKELFFFKKGVSLMIPESQKGPLKKRMDKVKDMIQKGSLPLLLASSFSLAILSSLVEIPCTAGLPIIYVSVLSAKGIENNLGYYLYLIYYNLLYVVPLILIVGGFVWTLKARQMSQRDLEILKFVGGLIMIVLGIILLINPSLVGMTIQ